MLTFDIEKNLAASRGWTVVCGVDEAGRGPLAGPVYAAAVCLGDAIISGVNDSKKLSEKRREALFDEITSSVAGYAIACADVAEIEQTDILTATLRAMRTATDELREKVLFDGALIDGNIARGFGVPALPVVDGDAKCPAIAAASVLAKVSRDRYMRELSEIYPQFNFAKHKGYGTKAHFAEIDRYGLCPEHRASFLEKHLNKSKSKTITSGAIGEQIALDYLKNQGWIEVSRNFHSRFGEIDLIVKNREYIAFVEVKLRENDRFAEAREFVDLSKQSKLRVTAEMWLAQNKTNLQPRFDVVEIYLPRNSRERERIEHIENAF